VDFAYLGETEVNQEHLESFLTVAKILKIKGLIGESLEQPQTKNPSQPLTTDDATMKIEETGVQNVINVESDLRGFSVVDLEEREDTYKMSTEALEYEVNKDRHSCSKCGNTFALQHNLRRHIRYAHEGVRYPCLDCSYKATTPSNLKRHQRSSHDQ